jgi:hypothetical protein
MDVTDFVVKHWKLVSSVLLLVLIVGFGMSKEEAFSLVEFLISFWG